MTSTYDPNGVPRQRQQPIDPLLSLPDHPSGEWATRPPPTPPPPTPRVGHPRPARAAEPHLGSWSGAGEYPLVAEAATVPAVLNGRGRTRLFTLLLVLLLLVVTGWLAYRLDRVAADNRELAAVLLGEQERAAVLGDRTQRLEKQIAAVFDPAEISAAVLPSVFRVRAGNYTGTAFAVGDQAPDGSANLLTNFHVVESVWSNGNRRVTLERGRERLTATISRVNRGRDLALLTVRKDVRGLTAAGATAQPGQQVVVVGSPLGLDDSVSTGVVSAYRPDDQDGPTVQFDAPINPGNSGGPVVGANAEVIGVATAKARDAEGIGLAIPIKTACDTFDIC